MIENNKYFNIKRYYGGDYIIKQKKLYNIYISHRWMENKMLKQISIDKYLGADVKMSARDGRKKMSPLPFIVVLVDTSDTRVYG